MFEALIFLAVVGVFILRTVRIVPQQSAYVVERLGQYHRTLNAGLHVVVPFIDSVRYQHSLKELVIDVPEQICITKDNVQVKVDGVLFMRVMDPSKASYGVSDNVGAVIQLAQTTLRSEMGKLELDKTFEEREYINTSVVRAIDPATDPWGVKVLRYELKSIQPPREILDAMEKQMRAEREKRAKILESEGDRDSKINRAEGDKQEIIKGSEAEKQRRINEAEGQAAAIKSVAQATAEGLNMVASSMSGPGGRDAAQLRVAEEYVKQFGAMAKETNTMILPANLADIAGLVSAAMTVIRPQAGKSANS
ncbi:MAG: Stomatin-like protein 2 [Pseudomonadota bacterium]|jgi:regulator of protease activity HflC (stomatin/prohibitin superfamily)